MLQSSEVWNLWTLAMLSLQSISSALVRPVDHLRARFLRALGKPVIPLVRRRDLRVLVVGSATMLMAYWLTLLSPFWLLALGPIIWGIPHLVADLRYLVVRPGAHRRWWMVALAGPPLVLAACGYYPMITGLLAAAGAALGASGTWWRKGLVLLVVAGLILVSLDLGSTAMLIFAHAHNGIAVLLWWCWRPRRQTWEWVPILLFLALGGSIYGGWVGPSEGALAGGPPDLLAAQHLATLAPGWEAPWGMRLVLLYAFAQTVHYGMWLRLIPEDDRPQETPRPLAGSLRALIADFGPVLFGLAVLAAGAIAIWGLLDLVAARSGYLRLALFHGFLELAALAWWVVEGRRLLGGARSPAS